MHDTGSGLRFRGIGTLGRRRQKRLDELMPEADDFVRAM